LFRVLDAISQKGKQYQEGDNKWKFTQKQI
jgi:hypothetical protein